MVVRKFLVALVAVAALATAAVTFAAWTPERTTLQQTTVPVMLILRGIASADSPRGQLDDRSALGYAQRLGFRGEVLDVAADAGGSPQVKLALERIRGDEHVAALYGFSGGG